MRVPRFLPLESTTCFPDTWILWISQDALQRRHLQTLYYVRNKSMLRQWFQYTEKASVVARQHLQGRVASDTGHFEAHPVFQGSSVLQLRSSSRGLLRYAQHFIVPTQAQVGPCSSKTSSRRAIEQWTRWGQCRSSLSLSHSHAHWLLVL